MYQFQKIEIIKERLFWYSSNDPPINTNNGFYFNLDQDFSYKPIYNEYGPLNISLICIFIKEMERILKMKKIKIKKSFYLHL